MSSKAKPLIGSDDDEGQHYLRPTYTYSLRCGGSPCSLTNTTSNYYTPSPTSLYPPYPPATTQSTQSPTRTVTPLPFTTSLSTIQSTQTSTNLPTYPTQPPTKPTITVPTWPPTFLPITIPFVYPATYPTTPASTYSSTYPSTQPTTSPTTHTATPPPTYPTIYPSTQSPTKPVILTPIYPPTPPPNTCISPPAPPTYPTLPSVTYNSNCEFCDHDIYSLTCISTPLACANLCAQERKCSHFTYVTNVNGGTCYIKSAIGSGGGWASSIPAPSHYICGYIPNRAFSNILRSICFGMDIIITTFKK